MPNHCSLMWFNGKIVPWEKGTAHVMSHGIHYGSGVFEGIKCYSTKRGPEIFRLEDHIDRMFASAELYQIPIPFSKADIVDGCSDLVAANGVENGYVRPVAFYGYDTLGVHPNHCPVEVAIAVFDWKEYLGQGALENGVRVTVSPWRKFHSSSLPTIAKANGQYLNSMLAAKDAKSKGYDEALLLNQEGTIAEGAGQNIFLVKDHVLYTNEEDSSILMGITRDTILELAKEKRIDIKIGRVSLGQLFQADEAFFTGTASEVTPICEVDKREIGHGKPGPITKDLQKSYLDIIYGKSEGYDRWLYYVNDQLNASDQEKKNGQISNIQKKQKV